MRFTFCLLRASKLPTLTLSFQARTFANGFGAAVPFWHERENDGVRWMGQTSVTIQGVLDGNMRHGNI